MTTTSTSPSVHPGSCVCGAVRFEATLDLATASRCNCTFCTKLGTTGVIARPAALRLLQGADSLATYGSNPAGHRSFCRVCGTHPFSAGHLEFLGGDYVSININTLDDLDLATIPVRHWDGRHDNWRAGPRPTPWPVFVTPADAAPTTRSS